MEVGASEQLTITATVSLNFRVWAQVGSSNDQVSGSGLPEQEISVYSSDDDETPGTTLNNRRWICLGPQADIQDEYRSRMWCSEIGEDTIAKDPPVIRVSALDNVYYPGSNRLLTFAVAVCPNCGGVAGTLRGTDALVNAKVLFKLPQGTEFVGAVIDDLSPDQNQPWNYDPKTGVWALPPVAKFINTLLVTVRTTSAVTPSIVRARMLGWEGNTVPNSTDARFNHSTAINAATSSISRPSNDDFSGAIALVGDRGTTSGDLRFATSTYRPRVGPSPEVIDIPGLPSKSYHSVWYTFETHRGGQLKLNLHTAQQPPLWPGAIRVFNQDGRFVFGTKSTDKFPTARGSLNLESWPVQDRRILQYAHASRCRWRRYQRKYPLHP